MLGKSFKLFKMLGFTVSMDWSWLILAALIAWSLAAGVFPASVAGLSSGTYWLMGIAGVLGLFVSIVFHELCHSLVARRYGLPMKGITLFIFGGIAEMNEEPQNPAVEFWMAIAGPLSSVLLAGLLFCAWTGLALLAGPMPRPAEELSDARQLLVGLVAVNQFLWMINLVLAVFNMIPAFPLDGGRVLRSALWGWKKDLRWATRVATRFGAGFGMMLIILGLAEIFFTRDALGGIWWVLIGWFVRAAARQSYQQLVMRQALEGQRVSQFMNTSPVTVPPDLRLQELVDRYVYHYGFAMFPVVQEGVLLGSVDVQQVKLAPREQWPFIPVSAAMIPPTPETTASPNETVVDLLARMRRTDQGRVMVVDDGRLVGIVTLKDLLKFLALKVELEEPPGQPPIRLAG